MKYIERLGVKQPVRGWAKVELKMLPSAYFQVDGYLRSGLLRHPQPPRRRHRQHHVVDRLSAPHLRLALLAEDRQGDVRRRPGRRARSDLRRQRRKSLQDQARWAA